MNGLRFSVEKLQNSAEGDLGRHLANQKLVEQRIEENEELKHQLLMKTEAHDTSRPEVNLEDFVKAEEHTKIIIACSRRVE